MLCQEAPQSSGTSSWGREETCVSGCSGAHTPDRKPHYHSHEPPVEEHTALRTSASDRHVRNELYCGSLPWRGSRDAGTLGSVCRPCLQWIWSAAASSCLWEIHSLCRIWQTDGARPQTAPCAGQSLHPWTHTQQLNNTF